MLECVLYSIPSTSTRGSVKQMCVAVPRPRVVWCVVCARVMHGYPIRRLPVPVPENADHGAGTGREMRVRVRVRIVNFHVLTRPRVFAQRLPYSAQYVDGVVGTLKGTHNLYQHKA